MNQRLRDEQETRNAAEVMVWVEHLTAHADAPIDLDLICHINRLVLRDTDRDHWAGRVRAEVDWQTPDDWSRPRAIVALEKPGLGVADEHTGQLLAQFPPDRDVGPMLDALFGWIASPQATIFHPIVQAAIFHQRFTAIHPFRDGNGRTARALTTLMLWRAGFPLQVLNLQRVLDERRTTYIATLREADAGLLQAWVHFFAEAVSDALRG